MSRRAFNWSKLQLDKLNRVIEIIKELQEYRPLTLRQIYYQMVGKGYIENNVSQYTMLSMLLKNARLKGYINWDDVEDRGRIYHNLTGYRDKNIFITTELENFLTGYRRDLMQTQNKYIEVWIEKDALSSIFVNTCIYYSVPVIVCRGYSSVTFLNNFKNRLKPHSDKLCLMLYFGDFDPSGMNMVEAMDITLKNELKVNNLEIKRVALQRTDIDKYKLPHNPTALKKADTRASKHIGLYGNVAVELDALAPAVLTGKIKTAVENELDINNFNNEVALWNNEFDKLNTLKEKLAKYIKRNINGL